MKVLQHAFIFQTFFFLALFYGSLFFKGEGKKSQPAVHMSRTTVILSSLHTLNVLYFSFVLLVCSPLVTFLFLFFCPHCLLRGNATDEHQGV